MAPGSEAPLLLERPTQLLLRNTARDDVVWPGTAQEDVAERGWLIERMARVLGLHSSSMGGGGAQQAAADGPRHAALPNEDDIVYEDEAAQFYGGPDLLSALPMELKVGARGSHTSRVAIGAASLLELACIYPSEPPAKRQARLVILYLPPSAFAALASTSRVRAFAIYTRAARRVPLFVMADICMPCTAAAHVGATTPHACCRTVLRHREILETLPLILARTCGISLTAALRCRAQSWHELSAGADSMWRDKLLLLENQWPGIVLPSEEGIIQYYEMGGTDPIAWARRRAPYAPEQRSLPARTSSRGCFQCLLHKPHPGRRHMCLCAQRRLNQP